MEDTFLSRIEALALETLRAMPESFGPHIRGIVVTVTDLRAPDIMKDMDIAICRESAMRKS